MVLILLLGSFDSKKAYQLRRWLSRPLQKLRENVIIIYLRILP